MTNSHWHFLPGRLPKPNVPVLVVKGSGRRSFVREAVYTGKGYWQGFGDAPVRAWQQLPRTPITIALKSVLDERDKLLDSTCSVKCKFPHKHYSCRTSKQEKRVMELDVKIEAANHARESKYESLIRRAALALRIADGQTIPMDI